MELSAHPGMAHVKRWLPRVTGVALCHYGGGKWTLIEPDKPPAQSAWILGQRGEANRDQLGLRRVDRLVPAGDTGMGIECA